MRDLNPIRVYRRWRRRKRLIKQVTDIFYDGMMELKITPNDLGDIEVRKKLAEKIHDKLREAVNEYDK